MTITQAREVNGRKLWLDPEVEEFVHILNHGHHGIGWEGDPLLGLFRLSDHRWEIARMERGEYRTVCISKPHAKLNLAIIFHLMDHDLQRQTAQQLFDAVEKSNLAVQAEADSKLHGSIAQAIEKVYWGVGKEVGHHY